MTKLSEIYDAFCEFAPPELQMSFDNAGFLVGRKDAEISRVILSLDVTSAVIDEAIERGAQLIISHHPVIWDAMKRVTDETETGRKLIKLIENGIAVISMHTNLDIARGGVNDTLLELLEAECVDTLDSDNCGRVGVLNRETNLCDFMSMCKNTLNVAGLRYYDASRPVKRIAVMGGSGGSSILDAYNKGCDTYVTADIKHSQFLTAQELGINLIDADHYCTEAPVMETVRERLSTDFPSVEFLLTRVHRQPARFF